MTQTRSRLQLDDRSLGWLLCLTLLLVYAGLGPGYIPATYATEHLQSARAFLDSGSFRTPQEWSNGLSAWPRSGYLEAALSAPLVWLARLVLPGNPEAEAWLASLLPAVLTAILITLAYWWSRDLGASRPRALAIVFTAGFATMLWPYTIIGLEPLLSVSTLGAGYALFRFGRSGSRSALVVAGLLAGAAIGAKTTGALAIPALGWYFYEVWRGREDRRWWVWLAFGLPILVVGVSSTIARDDFLTLKAYGGTLETIRETAAAGLIQWFFGIWGQLLSPNKGLIFYAPIVVLGALAWPQLYRREPALARWIAVLCAVTWIGIGSRFYWADDTWGPRYDHALVVPLMLPLAAADITARRWRVWRGTWGIMFALGLVTSTLGVLFWYGHLHTVTRLYRAHEINRLLYDPTWNPIAFQGRLLAARFASTPTTFQPSIHWWWDAPYDRPLESPGIELRSFANFELRLLNDAPSMAYLKGGAWLIPGAEYVHLAALAIGFVLGGWLALQIHWPWRRLESASETGSAPKHIPLATRFSRFRMIDLGFILRRRAALLLPTASPRERANAPQTSLMKTGDWVLGGWLFLAVLFVYISLGPGRIPETYATENLDAARAFLDTGSFRTPQEWSAGAPVLPRTGYLEAVLSMPLVWLARLLRPGSPATEEWLLSFFPAICTALLIAIAYWWSRDLGAGRPRSLAIALTAAFATPLWPYAGIGLQPLLSVCVLGAGYAIFRYERTRSLGTLILAGILAGAAIAAKRTGLLAVLALLWYFYAAAPRARRSWLWLVFGLPIVLFALSSDIARDDFLGPLIRGASDLLQKTAISSLDQWLAGVWGQLFSPNKGLILYAPIVLLGALAWPQLNRREPALARWAAILFVTTVAGVASRYFWADETWGPRYAHVLVIPLMLPLAVVEVPKRWQRAWRWAWGGLAGVGLAVALLGVLFWYGNTYVVTTLYRAHELNRILYDPTWNPIALHTRLLAARLNVAPGTFQPPVNWWWFAPPDRPQDFPPIEITGLAVLEPRLLNDQLWLQAGAWSVPEARFAHLTALTLGISLGVGLIWAIQRPQDLRNLSRSNRWTVSPPFRQFGVAALGIALVWQLLATGLDSAIRLQTLLRREAVEHLTIQETDSEYRQFLDRAVANMPPEAAVLYYRHNPERQEGIWPKSDAERYFAILYLFYPRSVTPVYTWPGQRRFDVPRSSAEWQAILDATGATYLLLDGVDAAVQQTLPTRLERIDSDVDADLYLIRVSPP